MVAQNTATLPASFGKSGFGSSPTGPSGSGVVATDTITELTASNGVTIDKPVSMSSTLLVTGALTLSAGAVVTGAMTISTTLGVTGILTATGGLRNGASGQDGAVSALQTGAGNGETINTASLGTARYKTNGAARTGVILQAGTYDGQTIVVINEDTTAANSITFAVVGTSNVANGVTTVINGLTGKRFVWSANATTPAWYPC